MMIFEKIIETSQEINTINLTFPFNLCEDFNYENISKAIKNLKHLKKMSLDDLNCSKL